MLDRQIRPVFQLAASLGCSWKNIERTHAETERAKVDLLALLEREVGQRFSSEDANLVVFGSLARGEWIDWQSDLDWTLLVDGLCKPLHFQIAYEIRMALKKAHRCLSDGTIEYRFGEPGATGTFGNMGFSHQLVHLIGGQEDTNKNTTQRILLLLESVRIGRGGAHERVIRAILQRYLEEEAHYLDASDKHFKVPRFLLNDIVRFWRTMAVDFASKQRDRGGEGWGLRNAKLRMSRKLIFASGLLTCFSCSLDAGLQSKISAEGGDKRETRDLNLVRLRNHMADWMSCTPLDILAVAIGEFGIDSEIGDNLFSAYDRFLGMVADPSNRKRLNQLRAEESRTDSVFREVRKISDKFAEALRRIFFESPNLSRLTQKYGVF